MWSLRVLLWFHAEIYKKEKTVFLDSFSLRHYPLSRWTLLPEGLELGGWHYIRASPSSLSPSLASGSSATIGIRHHFGTSITLGRHQGVKQGGIRHSWHCRLWCQLTEQRMTKGLKPEENLIFLFIQHSEHTSPLGGYMICSHQESMFMKAMIGISWNQFSSVQQFECVTIDVVEASQRLWQSP